MPTIDLGPCECCGCQCLELAGYPATLDVVLSVESVSLAAIGLSQSCVNSIYSFANSIAGTYTLSNDFLGQGDGVYGLSDRVEEYRETCQGDVSNPIPLDTFAVLDFSGCPNRAIITWTYTSKGWCETEPWTGTLLLSQSPGVQSNALTVDFCEFLSGAEMVFYPDILMSSCPFPAPQTPFSVVANAIFRITANTLP